MSKSEVKTFKDELSFEQRCDESRNILAKYPDRVPVIVERDARSTITDIDKKKYLVPADLTVGRFVYVIRKRIRLGSESALFVYVNGTLPPTSAPLSEIYQQHKDEDGFLYFCYTGENAYGSL